MSKNALSPKEMPVSKKKRKDENDEEDEKDEEENEENEDEEEDEEEDEYDLFGKNAIVFDAREPSEPMIYHFKVTNEMPRHMQHQLVLRSMFLQVNFEVGAESMEGLVDPDAEDADERTQEVYEYMEPLLVKKNELSVPFAEPMHFYISLASE